MSRKGWVKSTVGVVLVAAALPSTGQSLRARAQPQSARATISRIAWLAGVWVGGNATATFEEHWTAPAGGAMLAVSRTIKGDRMVSFEFLRIVEREGRLLYIAQPNGVPPTEFTLTNVTAESATFENPAHDFPRKIQYTKRSDGTLAARVSDGGARADTFVFRRAP